MSQRFVLTMPGGSRLNPPPRKAKARGQRRPPKYMKASTMLGCAFCERDFTSIVGLATHVRRIHNKVWGPHCLRTEDSGPRSLPKAALLNGATVMSKAEPVLQENVAHRPGTGEYFTMALNSLRERQAVLEAKLADLRALELEQRELKREEQVIVQAMSAMGSAHQEGTLPVSRPSLPAHGSEYGPGE